MSRSVQQNNEFARSREKAGRTSEGMPAGGWAAADLNLPANWYQALSRTATGCEYPISGDQQPEKREAA